MPARKRFFALAAAAAGAPAFARAATSPRVSWRFGWPVNASHPVNVRMAEAFENIRRETGGAFEIRSYPNGLLGSGPSMTQQLRLGALELEAASGGTFDTIVPSAGIESLAYAFRDKKTVFAAMDGELGRLIRRDCAAKGMFVFENVFDVGFRYFTTYSKPIRNAADLQGVKMRAAPGKLFVDSLRSLGIAATSLASTELYTALQTHLVDGQENGLFTIEGERFYEVQRYCALSRHQWAGAWILCNPAKWESLPAELQAIARKHINAAAIFERRDIEVMEPSIVDKLRRQNLAFNPVDTASLKAKLSENGYYARWRGEYGDAVWDALQKYSGPLG